MRRIETASELRAAWKHIATRLGRDLTALQRFALDPLGTLTGMGYDIGPEAAYVLHKALPS